MHCPIVSRKCARLRKRSIADVAREGPDVEMSPVVYNHAGALGELLVAAAELAHEACRARTRDVVHLSDTVEGADR